MVVSQSQVHHGSGYNLVTSDNWSVDDGVHSQNGTLRRVDDWSSHQGSKSPTIGNGESSSLHLFKSNLSILSFLCQTR